MDDPTDAPARSATPALRPDHFCILVEDLLAATRAWEALGFIVTQAGASAAGSNALIVLADGTYIELIQLPSPRVRRAFLAVAQPTGLLARMLSGDKAFMRRFVEHWTTAPRGQWIDWCLAADPLDAAVAAARTRGVAIDASPYTHERRTAGGDRVKWRMVGTLDPDLPFLIEDVPGHVRRAPIRLGGRHPNGATALGEVIVGAPKPEATLAALAALSGAAVTDDRVTIGGVTFRVEPAADRRFAGPVELVVTTEEAALDGTRLDPALTGGARLRLVVQDSPKVVGEDI